MWHCVNIERQIEFKVSFFKKYIVKVKFFFTCPCDDKRGDVLPLYWRRLKEHKPYLSALKTWLSILEFLCTSFVRSVSFLCSLDIIPKKAPVILYQKNCVNNKVNNSQHLFLSTGQVVVLCSLRKLRSCKNVDTKNRR